MDKYIKLKEMYYVNNPGKYSVLAYGVHKGRHFFIVSIQGQWPTAYVEARPGENYESMGDLFDGEMSPHGGLTYGPKNLLRLKDAHQGADIDESVFALNYWGWDYGHYGDYCTWMGNSTYNPELCPDDLGVKYTVDEIYEDGVVPFINLLEEKLLGATETKEGKPVD